MKNVFSVDTVGALEGRINALTPEKTALWGSMNAGQMLAHCNVSYDMAYEPEKFPRPNFMLRLMLKAFVKKKVVSDEPFAKKSPTAPAFIIKDTRDFELEKGKLIANIRKTQALGAQHFEGKESVSFVALTSNEWNTMFYKHLDHHLSQFGV
jgi:hypothetical protein